MTRELTDEEFVEALRLCRLADAAAEAGQTPAGHYLGKLRDLLAPDQAALDRAAADQAHRDDLARDVARLWSRARALADTDADMRSHGRETEAALDRLAAAYGSDTATPRPRGKGFAHLADGPLKGGHIEVDLPFPDEVTPSLAAARMCGVTGDVPRYQLATIRRAGDGEVFGDYTIGPAL